jgi:hypothetical protein
MEYQLSDESGHTQTTGISIEFPIIIQAQYDSITATSITETTVDVLANDTITDGSLGTVLLENYGINGVEYLTTVETFDGNWTVVAGQVIFTPSVNFSGGWVNMTYQLSDASGHTQTTWISIEFQVIGQPYSNIGSNPSALQTPNGGEIWTSGTSETILWDNLVEITGSTVDLYVLHDDPTNLNDFTSSSSELLANKIWYQFGTAISNSGSYQVDPSILNGIGNAYIILIVSSSDEWDISDDTFSLQ